MLCRGIINFALLNLQFLACWKAEKVLAFKKIANQDLLFYMWLAFLDQRDSGGKIFRQFEK